MITEANDFLAESEALFELINSKTDGELKEVTFFKEWSFDEIIRHLHVWNKMAYFSLTDRDEFQKEFESLATHLMAGAGHRGAELAWFGEMRGAELLAEWNAYYKELAAAFADADPDLRVPWAGPEMSAQSSITARLMETWSHAQAVYDELGVVRTNGDHIRSIAELGVRTYRWTFATRKQDAPLPKPHIRVTAPSGEIWKWNDASEDELIEGDAGEFCQVVTQTRNIADTNLSVTGPNATLWMSIAQCFAGGAEDPPVPGLRHTKGAQ
ncbi:MAG: TIGR03084 family metal-binding protein [Pseudomonadales bacterium]